MTFSHFTLLNSSLSAKVYYQSMPLDSDNDVLSVSRFNLVPYSSTFLVGMQSEGATGPRWRHVFTFAYVASCSP